MKHVHVDKVNTAFEIRGDMKVAVEGYDCGCSLKTATIDGGVLTIDGEVATDG